MSVASGFDKFPQILAHTAKRMGAFLGSRMFAGANALFEKLTGSAPAGTQGLSFFPHDHAYHGGVPIPRNNVYSYDVMNDSRWQISMTAMDTWYRHDRGDADYAVQTTSPPNRYGAPNFWAYVTPGIDSEKVNLVAGGANYCKLEAKMLIKKSNASADMYIRFYNRTTETYSAEKTHLAASIGYYWLTWDSTVTDDGIPCRGGVWNSFDIECKCDNMPNEWISVFSLVVSETRQSSQPVSAGTHVYSAAPKP